MLASKNGHFDIVKLLVEQDGIDINSKDAFLHCLMFISYY